MSTSVMAQKTDFLIFEEPIDSLAFVKYYDDSLFQLAADQKHAQSIKAENWSVTKFNPYSKTKTHKPFEIIFKDSSFASPVKGRMVITSRYGWRNGRPHRGIDIDLISGDTVMALFDGIVRFAQYSTGHGRTVIIRHENGLETAYAHLSKYGVKVNDSVSKGQYIGKGGSSGNARGSHLHLITSYQGAYIHPEYLFDFDKNNGIRKQELWITKFWYTASFHNSKEKSELIYFDSYREALASMNKPNQRKIYVVKPGDTLYGISNKHRVSVSNLCRVNAISKNTVLRIGERLIIN